jgi:ankyrin repeat protein
MATLQDLQNELTATLSALDANINALVVQINKPGISPTQQSALINDVAVLQLRRSQLSTTYLRNASGATNFDQANNAVAAANAQILAAAGQIVDVTSALQTAAEVISFIAQVATLIIPFL